MLVDLRDNFSFEQLHQTSGKYGGQRLVKPKSAAILDAMNDVGVSIREKHVAANQLLDLCAAPTKIRDSFKDYRYKIDEIMAKAWNDVEDPTYLPVPKVQPKKISPIQNIVDFIGRHPVERVQKRLVFDIQELQGVKVAKKHREERIINTAVTNCATIIDERDALNCQEFTLLGMDSLIRELHARKIHTTVHYVCQVGGDHNRIMVGDPSETSAEELATLDPWTPGGNVFMLTDGRSQTSTADWKIHHSANSATPLPPPDMSVVQKLAPPLRSPVPNSSPRKQWKEIQSLQKSGSLFNRISASGNVGMQYVNAETREGHTYSKVPQSLCDSIVRGQEVLNSFLHDEAERMMERNSWPDQPNTSVFNSDEYQSLQKQYIRLF